MKILFTAIVFFSLLSCSSNKVTKYYVVKPTFQKHTIISEASTSFLSDKSIGVGPVFVPKWLTQSFSVASYDSGNALRLPTYHIWAGELDSMIVNAISSDLSHNTGWESVWVFPWDNRHRPEYQIRVNIEEFSGEVGSMARVYVRWVLLSNHGKKEEFVRVEKLEQELPDESYETYTHTLNELLADFTHLLAKDLAQFKIEGTK